jgi:hypothetical protein
MKKYSMIQIDHELHRLLKEFCKDRGYKISGLVESLIKERINVKNSPPTNNILKSKI